MGKSPVKTILFVASCLALLGCSDGPGNRSQTQIVIRVDGSVLSLGQFNAFFEPVRMSYAKEHAGDDTGLREARARFLLELLDEMIILRRADELGLKVSAVELQTAMANIEGNYDDQSLRDMFLRQAISLKTWKERMRRQLLVEKVLEKDLGPRISVSPDEIRQYYDAHGKQWHHGEQRRVQHILLPSKQQAHEVLKKIKAGEKFGALARKYSTAPEGKQGGDMGYVVRGQLPERLEAAIFALAQGQVSPVIKSAYGYHIFKVIEKKQAGTPKIEAWIEIIRKTIRKQKLEAAYGPWLAKLHTRYKITVNKEIIR